ncbi:hypothetical protein BaRGS_00006411 [Batillaria attramentaria]|uniref:Radical S-adenosyl methionine domain-containing protein 1, mitochondrial n=1 Tax=Batillaria attramentaria TaxID=370345 RepID=A0ABD0LTL7_9CAEN
MKCVQSCLLTQQCLNKAVLTLVRNMTCRAETPFPVVQSPSPAVSDREKATLYVHWPYCKRRCTYCNFNKYISKNVDHHRMRNCLQCETQTLLRNSCVKEIKSVFFGGGTPSLAEPNTMECVLETAAGEVDTVSDGAEISMEVNPTNFEAHRLREFKLAGINRVSIGVQTLNDTALQILGRDHSSKDSLRCLELASSIFQKRTSVDLIFGYPGHSLKQWIQELQQMLQLCDSHISLYQLTLERGTQLFKDVTCGRLVLPSTDEVTDMYLAAVELLGLNGFEQYEVSNFAKGANYCHHNISYWSGQQYIGIGPGSHGRVWRQEAGQYQREARIQTLEPENWMREVERDGHATRKSTPQSSKEILEELLSVGLRTKWGISSRAWSELLPDVSLDHLSSLPRSARWLEEGYLMRTSQCLKATPSGLIILDSILPDLLLDLDTLTSRCETPVSTHT